MNKNKFSFFKGLGHIAIWPSQNYQQFVPKDSVNSRLSGHWLKVGGYFHVAMQSYVQTKANNK